MYTLPLDYSRVGFRPLEGCGRRDGFLPFGWLVAELLRREGGDYLPRLGSVGTGSTPLYNRSTTPALVQSVYVSKTADYEVMKYLEDFQLTSGSRCVLYKGTGRTLFWCLREAKWSGEA